MTANVISRDNINRKDKMETKIEKFYNCKYDRAFKEVMLKEKNKDLLKLLLEHILKEEVKEIKIMPTERNRRNI